MTSNIPSPRDSRPSMLFFHAHPDDESIFTGGTIARLADRGVGVTVVIATDDHQAGRSGWQVRRLEAEMAAAALKVDRLEFLGYPDSGLGPSPSPGTFATIPTEEAADRLAHIAREIEATAIVTYDPGGIYGHPDHLAVHHVGKSAALLAGIPTVYEATVDREHLHFVATHLVGDALEALMQASITERPEGLLADVTVQSHDGKLAGGTSTVLIDTMVDVSDVLDRKRAAMAAHASQIPPDSEVILLDDATFAAVYGHEWYVRTGPPTVLDLLARV